MPDAINLLKEDHKKVRRLLKKLEEANGASERTRLLTEIEAEVTVHAQVEEEIFYPAYLKAVERDDDTALFHEAAEEHRLVKEELPRAAGLDAASPEFQGVAKVLKDLIEHHAEEEETEMFPVARRHLSEEELDDLGRRILQRKGELGADAKSPPAKKGSAKKAAAR